MLGAIDWSDELAKAAITFGFVAVLGGVAGVLFGMARHRRERDLAALARFYDVYGMWFATWKEWSEYGEKKNCPPSRRNELLAQAAAAEGQFEALLVRIAIERRLSKPQQDRLGRFRQGYQRLRESIEHETALRWNVQRSDNDRRAYVTFKALSVEFASLLCHRWWPLGMSKQAFVAVTSWRVAAGQSKDDWWRAPAGDSVRRALDAMPGCDGQSRPVRISMKARGASDRSS